MEDSIFFLYDYSALFGKSSPRGYYLQMSSEELYVPRMPARGMRKLIGFSIFVFFRKKRFFLLRKTFFMRKNLTPGRVKVICVNLVVFRPVDFHGRFYFFS